MFTRTKRQKYFTKIMVWLLAEILLTFMGLDDLADYSEFVFERNVINLHN